MVPRTSEQDEGWDRDRQNIVDLQNGGHKFILDGKTLQLPGVTASDSRSSMLHSVGVRMRIIMCLKRVCA